VLFRVIAFANLVTYGTQMVPKILWCVKMLNFMVTMCIDVVVYSQQLWNYEFYL